MKWDYFIYSRGVDQKDDYCVRKRPEYLVDKVIRGCMNFMNMRVREKEFAEAYPSFDDSAWNKSFMFLPIKQFNCCVLVRTVRIEDPETGKGTFDFSGRPIWSMEGVSCPYEMIDYFFASIPSMLLWFLQNSHSSLCTMFATGMLGDYIEIPDELVFNPMDEDFTLPDPAYNLTDKEFETVLLNLASEIHCSDEPFGFFVGPFAEEYKSYVGNGYKVKKSFCTINPIGLDAEDQFFSNYKEIEQRREDVQLPVKKKKYVLKCRIEPDKKESAYMWNIIEDTKPYPTSVISSEPVAYDGEKGISACRLLSEAHSIRALVSKMGWKVQQYDEMNLTGNYEFEKEE